MIRGIGPVYARKLVRSFGAKVFDVIEAEPEQLREVTQKAAAGCVAGSNGDRNDDDRPLWTSGLSPPESWRSLCQGSGHERYRSAGRGQQ